MYGPSLLLAASACVRFAYAEFYIITEPPVPLSMLPDFPNSEDQNSWTTSVVNNAEISYERSRKSLGPEYSAEVTSIDKAISDFVASASNYSIPAAVTDPDTTTRIVGKPSWYDALPSDVKSFKEREWETMKRIASEVVAARLTTTGSQGGASPALPTGAVGLKNAGWAVAGAAAAAFL